MSAYTLPLAVAAGSLVVGGQTPVLVPGTALTGDRVHVRDTLCGTLTTDPQGGIDGDQISGQGPVTGSLCGTVTAYVPPTFVSAGSITIAGTTPTLPAGWVPPAPITVNGSLCLQVPGGGSSGSPTPTPAGRDRLPPGADQGDEHARDHPQKHDDQRRRRREHSCRGHDNLEPLIRPHSHTLLPTW